jgi:replication factor C subunit 2/4
MSKIIDPLTSRCVKFRFSPISRVAQIERLKFICQNENVKVQKDSVFDTLVDISEGDLRRSINMLQTASSFKNHNLSDKDIHSISGIVPNETISKIENALVAHAKLQEGGGFNDLATLASDLVLDGFDI